MGLKPFQVDLRNGMSIDDALKKHNLTLQEAVMSVPCNYGRKRNQKWRTDTRNINKRGEHFIIVKKKDGRTKTYGTYDSLKSAQMVRDCLDDYGWEQLDVGLICALLGVERCRAGRGR